MCNQSQSVGWRAEHQSVVISVHVMSLSTMFSSQQHKADVFVLTRPFITDATPSGFVMIQSLQSLR